MMKLPSLYKDSQTGEMGRNPATSTLTHDYLKQHDRNFGVSTQTIEEQLERNQRKLQASRSQNLLVNSTARRIEGPSD